MPKSFTIINDFDITRIIRVNSYFASCVEIVYNYTLVKVRLIILLSSKLLLSYSWLGERTRRNLHEQASPPAWMQRTGSFRQRMVLRSLVRPSTPPIMSRTLTSASTPPISFKALLSPVYLSSLTRPTELPTVLNILCSPSAPLTPAMMATRPFRCRSP